MNSAQRLTALTILMLTAPTLICLASGDRWINEAADCQPQMPPQDNPNATHVATQFHQWIWIENLTAPDYGPRTERGGMIYEFLKPGVAREQRLPLLVFLIKSQFIYINVSFVTNGDTLCTAALTQHRNKTSGELDRTSCSRNCHNFTTAGPRVNLPLLVYENWTEMTRYSEFLAFDAVDPDSRTAYTCMGHIKMARMSSLPSLLIQQRRCLDGDVCLFSYDSQGSGFVDAGCRTNFAEHNWCVSDVSLCSFNINGICPVCCRGDLCNRDVAQKAYQLWLESRRASSSASSIWMLASCALGLLALKWH